VSDQVRQETELVSHVLETAQKEANAIRDEAEASLADRRAALERRLSKIRQDAKARIEEESTRLRSRADATIELERNRSRLRLESRIYRVVEDRVRTALTEQRDADDYPAVIRSWIVEAVRGLGVTEATVSCPPDDLGAVRAVLDAAVSELAKTYNAEVTLALDEETRVTGQGVVVRNVPPTMAYSNTVNDRMRRYGAQLRALVYHAMIEEPDE
jgi:vacuolar-type H+-ATPase subunit E/Vma4